MTNTYTAPITLGFTPADGDFIRGTVNGVEVDGKWVEEVAGVNLYPQGDTDTPICYVRFLDGQAIVCVMQDSAPTTDYELHLYRYTPADIVQIPQEYVEGLEDVAADATAAKTAAETAQSTANTAKTTAETAQSTANNALTKKNGGISEGVIGGTSINAVSSLSSTDTYCARFNYQGLCFYQGSAVKPYTRIDSNGYSVFGYIDTKHITLSPMIGSSGDAYMCIESDDTKSVSISANGEIYANNPDKTLNFTGVKAFVVGSSTSNSNKKIKLTVSDDARPTFTDTSDPNNTWTPGENLPTVTSSDSGKFLRVSSTGAWEAEEGIILNSSTAGSTKKFKITVDDAGVISATEVTT